MAIKKQRPLVLPPYRWDGSSYNWNGRQILGSTASQLPIAYLVSQILAETGHDPFYVGKYANRLSYAPRRPNVLLCWEDQYHAFMSSPEFVAMLDRNGVIVANLQHFTAPNGNDEFGEALTGLPVVEMSGYYYLKNPETYVGGRLFVLQQALVTGLFGYLNGELVHEDIVYSAPPGTDLLCNPYSMGAGSIPLDSSYNLTTGYNFYGYYDSKIAAVRSQSQWVKQAFERLAVFFLLPPDPPEEQTWTSEFTCSDGFVHNLFGPSPGPVPDSGWDGPVLSVTVGKERPIIRLHLMEVASRLSNDVFFYGDTVDYSRIIAFFDS